MKVLYTDRFMAKVGKASPGDCWEWTGSRDGYGYGMFRVGPGRVRRAHRVSYELVHGPVPDGTVFLHACDNPPCVNPAHLRPGTHAENARDRDRKGRQVAPRGARNGNAVLRDAEAEQLKAWLSYGFSGRQIASWFGIHEATVSAIKHGRFRK